MVPRPSRREDILPLLPEGVGRLLAEVPGTDLEMPVLLGTN